MNDNTISRQAAIEAVKKNTFRLTFAEEQNCEGHVAWSAEAVYSDVMEGALLELPSAEPEQKSCKTCHLWENGELNIACPWGSNYEHYEDDYCSLWEKQN